MAWVSSIVEAEVLLLTITFNLLFLWLRVLYDFIVSCILAKIFYGSIGYTWYRLLSRVNMENRGN